MIVGFADEVVGVADRCPPTVTTHSMADPRADERHANIIRRPQRKRLHSSPFARVVGSSASFLVIPSSRSIVMSRERTIFYDQGPAWGFQTSRFHPWSRIAIAVEFKAE